MIHNGAKCQFLFKLLIINVFVLCQEFFIVEFLHTLW